MSIETTSKKLHTITDVPANDGVVLFQVSRLLGAVRALSLVGVWQALYTQGLR